MSSDAPGDTTVEIIGGFPKQVDRDRTVRTEYDEKDSTAWDIRVPGTAIPAPETPKRPGYNFGTTMGSFSYVKEPQTSFGIEDSERKPGWTSPAKTPKARNTTETQTPQGKRDAPPHMSEDATPPGLNQTSLPFEPSKAGLLTSTVQSKGKEVLRLPQATRKISSTQVNDGRMVESVSVEPWTRIEGPLKGILQDEKLYTKVIVEFFSCMDTDVLQYYPIYAKELLDRRHEALRIGRAFLLQRKFISPHIDGNNSMTNKERQDLIKMTKDLDDLLKCLERYEDDYFVGYRLEKGRFQEFNRALLELRTVAKDQLIMAGVGLQDLPCWGLDGNINDFWESNDFEILATCYRHEVVQYVTTITRTMENGIATIAEMVNSLKIAAAENKEAGEPKEEKTKSMYHDAPTPIATRIQNFTNQNASIFGNPSKHTSSRKLADMLSSNRTMVMNDDSKDTGSDKQRRSGRKGPGDDNRTGNDTNQRKPPARRGESGGSGGGGEPGDSPGNAGYWPPVNQGTVNRGLAIPQFDNKLKVDVIPTWNGNPDELGRWILKINRLSERSAAIFQQLGYLVPTRLTDAAELWYYSQSAETRARVEENWGTLRSTIAGYFMNRSFLEKQRIRANRARYRDMTHPQETPSEYFIRKLELLEIVYNYSEGELINEIMAGAPTYWSTVLTPHLYDNIEGFQMAIKFQEDNLLRMGYDAYRVRQEYGLSARENPKNPFSSARYKTPEAKVNAVGWSPGTSNHPYPKDDANVSPRGTPVSKGGRPCRHCGSDNHWDPECRHARKGEKKARVNAVSVGAEEIRAQQDYDELFYSIVSDDSEDEDF